VSEQAVSYAIALLPCTGEANQCDVSTPNPFPLHDFFSPNHLLPTSDSLVRSEYMNIIKPCLRSLAEMTDAGATQDESTNTAI
jgi:hypothetical protein